MLSKRSAEKENQVPVVTRGDSNWSHKKPRCKPRGFPVLLMPLLPHHSSSFFKTYSKSHNRGPLGALFCCHFPALVMWLSTVLKTCFDGLGVSPTGLDQENPRKVSKGKESSTRCQAKKRQKREALTQGCSGQWQMQEISLEGFNLCLLPSHAMPPEFFGK